ncbi:MAG: discoidin domain-containing protein [Verrucomicrobiota bacterium]
MKVLKYIVSGILMGGTALATPLDETQISHEAKWLAHIDIDSFEDSLLGQMAIDHIKSEIAKENDSNISINVDEVLKEVHSITAYGTSFDDDAEMNSLLIMNTGNRAQAIIDGFLTTLELEKEGKTGFKTIDSAPYPTYLFEEEVYISFPKKTLIVASKSWDMVKQGMAVVDGETASIDEADTDMVLDGASSFFFVATANGLDRFDDLPAQARVLQKATGGRVAIGEDETMLRANVMLTTQGPEVSSQLARIIQGMLALVSFAEVDDKSLLLLTQNTRVSQGEKFVSLDLSYPTEEIVKLVESLAEGDRAKAGAMRDKPKKDPRYEVEVDDGIGGDEVTVRNVDASGNNGNLPYFAIDGDASTYWGSQGRNDWIRFLLAEGALVREIKIAFRHGDERRTKFAVQKSDDGNGWEDVIYLRSGGQTFGLESFNIPDTASRWIRLRCFGNDKNAMNVISDIQFIGETSN